MANNKVYSSFIWRFAESCGAQAVSFVVSVVLARLLLPEDYGTVALIIVIINVLNVFVDSGLGTALIQKKDADNIDFSTVFFTNIAFCTFMYGILYVLAPYIGVFYEDLAISSYIRVLGITVVVSGIKNIQQAYVSRHMLFKKFFFATIGGTIAAGIIGVFLALNGYGVWALVAQQIINLTTDTLILWITVKWRPDVVFSFQRLKVLYGYGWKMLASALIDTLYLDIRQLLIGKIYSSFDLAQYNRGNQFPKLIVHNVNTSIDSVLLPAMSNEQDDKDRIKSMTRRSIRISTYVMAPMMMGLAFCGKSVVGLVLTDKWLPAVFFMQIFCVSYMFYPIHTANLNAIKAMGRSDIFLKLEILKKIIGIIVLLATIFVSVKAMACSLLFTSITSQMINSWPNKKLLDYGYIEQLKDILPAVCLSIFMGIIIYPVQCIGLSYWATLLIQVPMGVFIYILGSRIFKFDSLEYLCDLLQSYVKRNTKRG